MAATWLQWIDWLDKNRKRAGRWAGGVVAVILIITAIVYQQARKEVRASEALANVEVPLSPGAPAEPGTVEALLALERDHPNTQAAARALLIAAGLRFVEGQHAEAEKLFGRFEQDYPESVWLPQAMLGHATALEILSQADAALAEYERLRKLYPNDPIANDVLLGLARLYEAQDKPAEALKIYQDMLQTGYAAYTAAGAQAGARQEALLQKYPDLIKTNTPIIEPTGMTNVMSLTNLQQAATNRAIPITLTNLLKQTNLNVSQLTNRITSALTNVPVPPLTNLTAPTLPGVPVPPLTNLNLRSAPSVPAPPPAPVPKSP